MTWWVRVVVLAGVTLELGCGSTASHPSGTAGAAGTSLTSGGSSAGAGTSQGGGGGATSAGSGTTAGAGGSGGATASSCMSRTTNHIAGTRLKFHVVVSSEGDRAWDGFYDSMTGEDCADTLAGDGKVRCVPLNRFQSQAFFADAACSDPIYTQSPTCPTKYLELYDTSVPCMPQIQLFLAGAAYTGPVFQAGPNGACTPAAADQLTFARKGAVVDPTTLAEFEPGQLQEPGRIARVGYKSADGAFMVRGYHDTTLDADCNFGLLRDGKQHCVPRFNFEAEYSDATCTTTLLGVSTACGAKPQQYFSRSAPAGCGSQSVIVKADQPFTGAAYTLDRGAGPCTAAPAGPTPDLQLFTSADQPDSIVPEVTLTTVDTDPGRLKPRYRTASDGSCSFDTFWDSELGVECTFSRDASGDGYHCYPDTSGYPLAQGFSDAGCTAATAYTMTQTCLAAQVPKYATTWLYGACNVRTPSVRQVGPGMAGAAVAIFVGVPGSCAPLTTDPDTTYFTLGPELPPDTFMSGQRAPL